jgi:hypothetical protein
VFFFGSTVNAPQSVTQPSRRYQNFVTMLPSKPKTQPERPTSLLYFLLPKTHFLSRRIPNFTSFQSIVKEDKRGPPANSSDSLALCSKCSACHCIPIPFPNWPCTSQSVSRQTSSQRPRFKLRAVLVRFGWAKWHWDRFLLKCSRFPYQYHSTNAPHSSSPTFCPYPKPGNLPKKRCLS